MVELEYKGVKIQIPENWDDITLAEWDRIYRQRPKSGPERVAFVAQLCKVDEDTVRSWPYEIFNMMVARTRFVFGANPYAPASEITLDGVRYIIAVEDDLTLGEWIDAEEAQKAGDAVLANVLAVVCRPAGEAYDYRINDKRRAMFEALPTSSVLPLLGFFLHCKQQSDKLTKTSLQLAELAALLPPNTAIFQSLGVGTKLLRIWPIMRYLFLTKLLRYRLRKLLISYGISETRPPRKRRNGN